MKLKLNDFLPDGSAPDKVSVSTGIKGAGDYRMITGEDIKHLFKTRASFSHKGTYGHALIIAGAPQTMGAALLSAMGCLYAGAGLITAAIPESGLSALNTAVPEVMYVARKELLETKKSLEKYDAVGIGPGLSTGKGYALPDAELLDQLIREKVPIVADADALALMKGNAFRSISKGSVLTPHMKEFDTFFGPHDTWWERLETARSKARKKGIVIVLKNRYTFIIGQEGTVHINPTGNPGMAQGGMGDVLTGIITAYRAQKYDPLESAVLACYFHGKAGDDLATTNFSITASALAKQLPKSIRNLIG